MLNLNICKASRVFASLIFLAKASQASISGRNVVIECSDIGKVALFHHLVLQSQVVCFSAIPTGGKSGADAKLLSN